MVLVILYLIYILVMYFNRFLEKKCISAVERLKKKYVKAEQIDVTDTSSEERQPLSGNITLIEFCSENVLAVFVTL